MLSYYHRSLATTRLIYISYHPRPRPALAEAQGSLAGATTEAQRRRGDAEPRSANAAVELERCAQLEWALGEAQSAAAAADALCAAVAQSLAAFEAECARLAAALRDAATDTAAAHAEASADHSGMKAALGAARQGMS